MKQFITKNTFNSETKRYTYCVLAADIETIVIKGIHMPFCIGWKCSDLNITRFEYTRDIHDIENYSVLHIFLSEIFKLRNIISSSMKICIYFHNLSGFDGIIILKSIILKAGYNINITSRGSKIMRIIIRMNGKVVELRDSMHILPLSLDKLGKSFLNKGKRDIDPIFTIKRLEEEKSEIIAYLLQDVEILEDVLKYYNRTILKEFGMNSFKYLTATSISYNIFKAKYLNNNKIEVPDDVCDKFIRKAYHGGRCEVFIPKVLRDTRLYHYDFNSQYPAVMMNQLPTSIEGWYRPLINDPIDPFTIYDVVIRVPTKHIPVVPLKASTGELIFPVGTYRTIINGVELKYAVEQGYAYIKSVHRSLKLGSTKKIFKEFITTQYERRLKAKSIGDPIEKIFKLNMNSLYGRFAMIPVKRDTAILESSDKDCIKLHNHEGFVNSYDMGKYTIFYFDKKLSGYKKMESASYISSYITSYARIELHKVMSKVNDLGGNVYYCDTDSVVTDIQLLEESTKLGGLHLENEYEQAYFLAPKMYGCMTISGDIVLKGKGIINSEIKRKGLKFFDTIYKSIEPSVDRNWFFSVHRDFIRSLKTFQIMSGEKKYTMMINEKKRKRVYAGTSWIDTVPISKDTK